MNVVGFDVGKDSLFAARIDRSGSIKEHWELANTKTDILPLLKRLKSRYRHLLVASEATAEYHRPVAELCLELGIEFRLLNPITTKQFTRATVRKRKTDKTDAEVIARVAMQGDGSVVTKQTFNTTKPMLRTAIKLVQMSQMLNLIQQHHKVVLPDEPELLELLVNCQSQLLDAAKTFRDTAMGQVNQDLSGLLQSIPGIGQQTAALLIAELGDIDRSKDAKAIVAFVGLDPRVRQSGTSLKRNTRLTKRGSPYLRKMLYVAASSAERHNPELKATYDKKRDEGKRYTEATIVVARKLIYRVYAVWKRQTPYRV